MTFIEVTKSGAAAAWISGKTVYITNTDDMAMTTGAGYYIESCLDEGLYYTFEEFDADLESSAKRYYIRNTTNLKETRERRGLSQSGLAERSGVSVRTIQHYEQGDKDINKAAAITVKKMADALNVKIEDILEI